MASDPLFILVAVAVLIVLGILMFGIGTLAKAASSTKSTPTESCAGESERKPWPSR